MPARAGDMVDNHKYQAWAKFKPGSSSTISADIDKAGNKIHLDMTRKLVSLDDDKVVIEVASTVTFMGHDHAAPTRQETYPAKIDKEKVDIKKTGDKEIDAMGKTFKCTVYEATGDPDAPTGRGAVMNPDNMKATAYISDDVPGGLVRLDGKGQDGKDMTLVLTAMETK